jgi:osmotically-inducible protein OsmY
MSTAQLTDRDLRTRTAVLHQLEWDPAIDASAIGVAARDGSVTLTGLINTYGEKLAAERAAKRVYGVRAVANELEVRLAVGRTDADVAADAAVALKIHSAIPDAVQAAVHHGHVTLTGTVPWLYQKLLAEKTVRHISGVRDVANYITVLPRAGVSDVRHRIMQALHRTADIEASKITVTVAGTVARLAGTAPTWAQRDAAAHAAAAAPGITMVDNQIVVEPADRPFDQQPDEIC